MITKNIKLDCLYNKENRKLIIIKLERQINKRCNYVIEQGYVDMNLAMADRHK
jgi:hypothetical protein